MFGRLVLLTCALAAAGCAVGVAGAAAVPPAIFGAPTLVGGSPGPFSPVTVADVDNDGDRDLVLPAAGEFAVGLHLANGDGTFQPRRLYNAAGLHEAAPVGVGDLTGDGEPDLAVAHSLDGGVRVLPGPFPDPIGTPAPSFYPTGNSPYQLALGDLNADGRLDLVIGDDFVRAGADSVAVLLASLSGGFGPPVHYVTGKAAALELADVNADSALDIVVANYDLNTVSVLLGRSDGTFQAKASFGGDSLAAPFAVASGDMNGDGRVDLAVGQRARGLALFLGNGDGTFVAGEPCVVLEVPDGLCVVPPWLERAEVFDIEVADFNSDGKPEVALAVNEGFQDDPSGLVVLIGRGDGEFTEFLHYPLGNAVGVVEVGDLNGDHRPDVVATSGDASGDFVWTLLNQIGPLTPTGVKVVVAPLDPTSGTTPVTITFANVTARGETTVTSSSSGPQPPAGFEIAGVYYELATTAQFDATLGAEVCFSHNLPTTPTVGHFENVAWTTLQPSRPPTANEICVHVTSFSPFALLVPASGEDDLQPPMVSCGEADGAWHGANVSIDCTARDDGSGLADPADAAFSLATSVPAGTEDGDAATGKREICDRAGNCATAGPIAGNKVDRKAPTLALPADKTVDATSPAGATVSYDASATDDADPSPAASCTPPSGSVFAIGGTSVACTATDHVGNTATGGFTVTVRGAKQQLARLIQDVVTASRLPAAVKTQLLARLEPLLAAFDPTDPTQRRIVCTGLAAFRTVVRLLAGPVIAQAQAAAWIADVNRIRSVIGC